MSDLVFWPIMYDPFGDAPMDYNISDTDRIRRMFGSSSRGRYSEDEWDNMYNNLNAIFTNMQNTIRGETPKFLSLNIAIRTAWSEIMQLVISAAKINDMVDSQVADILKELNERFHIAFQMLSDDEVVSPPSPPSDTPSAFGSPSAGSKPPRRREPMLTQVLKAFPKRAPTSSSSSAPSSSSASMPRQPPMTVSEMRRRARLQAAEGRRSSGNQSRIDELRRQARERAMGGGRPSKRRKDKLRF